MGTEMVRQTMFNTGEVDETTYKRTDVKEYLTAAQSLQNAEVGTTGLAKKRKGMLAVGFGTTFSNYCITNSRMYEFIDKDGNFYLLISNNLFFNIFSVVGDTVTQIQTLNTTPYVTNDLPALDYTQDNDTVVFTHPNYQPGRIFISSYPGGSSPPVFAFEYLNIYPLPAYDFNKINYNNFTVALSVTGSVLTFQFTGVGADPGFTNDWIGGQIIGGGATDLDPIGYAIITAVSYSGSGGGTVTFTATVQVPFLTTGYSTSGSQYSVRQPAWSSTLGYPAKVLFYQNRLWLAYTKSLNNTIFGSRINSPINFDVGTGADTDAIVYTIGQTNSGAILWLNGGKQMEIYTENFEFACPQDQNSALTPGSFSIRQQSAFGSSRTMKPITYINDSYYMTKTGKALANYHFNGIGLTYTSTNISVASSHLVKNPSNRALLRGSDTSQDNFVYYLNQTDNTITSFQFAFEYKLAALTPIIFQSNVNLIDITTINNEVYVLKYYSTSSRFALEKFTDSVKIDAARTASMASDGTITGLDDLNGYTVQVVYQNQDFGEYLVSGGQVTVDNPSGVSGTVTVGLLFNVIITPMYIFAGSMAAPFYKNITQIYVDYYNSIDFSINGTLVPYQNFTDIQDGLPLQPQTDTAIIDAVSGWNRFGDMNEILTITQSSPFDLQILGIGYQVDVAVI